MPLCCNLIACFYRMALNFKLQCISTCVDSSNKVSLIRCSVVQCAVKAPKERYLLKLWCHNSEEKVGSVEKKRTEKLHQQKLYMLMHYAALCFVGEKKVGFLRFCDSIFCLYGQGKKVILFFPCNSVLPSLIVSVHMCD